MRHYTSLAVTLGGLPLGLTAIKFWSRDKFYGCNQLKKRINPTRIPIEEKESYRRLDTVRQSTALVEQPQCCVHIADRESDIYELFCTAQAIRTHFLLRTCVDRLAGDGKHTIAAEMAEVRIQSLHRIQVRDRKGKHRFTRPYTPRTNGKAERFFQTALREWAYARTYQNSEERSQEFGPWLHLYNWHRPHAILGQSPPISRSGLEGNNLLSHHS